MSGDFSLAAVTRLRRMAIAGNGEKNPHIRAFATPERLGSGCLERKMRVTQQGTWCSREVVLPIV
jgi:hypothetical protein